VREEGEGSERPPRPPRASRPPRDRDEHNNNNNNNNRLGPRGGGFRHRGPPFRRGPPQGGAPQEGGSQIPQGQGSPQGQGDQRPPLRRRRGPPRDYQGPQGDQQRSFRPRQPRPPRPYREPRPDQGPRTPSLTTLFVANLPFSVDDQGLSGLFQAFNLKSAHVVTKRNDRSKGFGFVEFNTEDDQKAALAKLDNTEVQGRKLIVKVALAEVPRAPQQGEPSNEQSK